MSQWLTERYGDRIAGMLSCYDRLVITGTLPVLCDAAGMNGIPIFDYPGFARMLRATACVTVLNRWPRRGMDRAVFPAGGLFIWVRPPLPTHWPMHSNVVRPLREGCSRSARGDGDC